MLTDGMMDLALEAWGKMSVKDRLKLLQGMAEGSVPGLRESQWGGTFSDLAAQDDPSAFSARLRTDLLYAFSTKSRKLSLEEYRKSVA